MVKYIFGIEVIVGLLALVVLHYGLKKIFNIFGRKKGKKPNDWRSQIDSIVQPPITLILWIFGIVYVIDVIGHHFGSSIAVAYLYPFRKAMIVGSFTWMFFRWKNEYQKALLTEEPRRIDVTTIAIVGRLMTIGAVVIAALIVMQIFGFNTAPLLAFGSIGAASIGFAGKDVMANFCSGMMLHITRPFIVTDLVFLPDKNLEGHIEEIGWFRTLIRDKEKRAVYLPNNFFSTMLVINGSRMTHRRFFETIQVGFESGEKIGELTSSVRKLVMSHRSVDTRLPVHVHFTTFGKNGCDIVMEAYSTEIDQDRFYQVEQELLLKIQEKLKEMGIEMATPTIIVRQS